MEQALTVEGIVAIEKNKIWHDIMFFIDGSPISIELSPTCSVDRWIFMPMFDKKKTFKTYQEEKDYQKSINNAFFTQISKLFNDLIIHRNAYGNKLSDGTGFFDGVVFDCQMDRGTITFKEKRDVLDKAWYSYKLPRDAYITLTDVPIGDPCAREIALLLHNIISVNAVVVNGFFRTHLYDSDKKIKELTKILYMKHYEKLLS
jgi:hypothetical protein